MPLSEINDGLRQDKKWEFGSPGSDNFNSNQKPGSAPENCRSETTWEKTTPTVLSWGKKKHMENTGSWSKIFAKQILWTGSPRQHSAATPILVKSCALIMELLPHQVSEMNNSIQFPCRQWSDAYLSFEVSKGCICGRCMCLLMNSSSKAFKELGWASGETPFSMRKRHPSSHGNGQRKTQVTRGLGFLSTRKVCKFPQKRVRWACDP